MKTKDYIRTVLSAKHAVLSGDAEARGEYAQLNFDLYSGQLALVRLYDFDQTAYLADALSGLQRLSGGSVRFLGRDWTDVSADEANAMRGKIGRVFGSGQWLEGFSVADNILLPQLHHTRRPKNDLTAEAAKLAEQFRLPGLPLGKPNEYSLMELQKAACVRSFMGKPALLILEEPTFGVYPAIMAALMKAIRRGRDNGAAVFWMTLSDDIWLDASIPADRFFRITGRELTEVRRQA